MNRVFTFFVLTRLSLRLKCNIFSSPDESVNTYKITSKAPCPLLLTANCRLKTADS